MTPGPYRHVPLTASDSTKPNEHHECDGDDCCSQPIGCTITECGPDDLVITKQVTSSDPPFGMEVAFGPRPEDAIRDLAKLLDEQRTENDYLRTRRDHFKEMLNRKSRQLIEANAKIEHLERLVGKLYAEAERKNRGMG